MSIIDISWPISNEIITYKNKKDVVIQATKNFELDGFRESKISCGVHTGTHIDAPAHFMEHGKTIDQLDLSQLMGQAQIVDLTHVTDKITKTDLEHLDFSNCKILLFKTKIV